MSDCRLRGASKVNENQIEIVMNNQKINSKSLLNMGHGARDAKTKRVAHKLAVRASKRLDALSKRVARGRAYKIEARSGIEVTATTLAEFEAIIHAAIVPPALQTGIVVDYAKLFLRAKRGGCNPYSFRVRLAWVRALRAGARSCGAEAYRNNREHDNTASLDDLLMLENQIAMRKTENNASDEEFQKRRISRRVVRHARESLIVFWSMSGSRKWRGGLASDLDLLTRAVSVSRGAGFEVLGSIADSSGDFRGSAASRAVRRLAERIAAGDELQTIQPDQTQTVLDTWLQGAGKTAANAESEVDYLLIS